MGGDNAPEAPVRGTIEALRRWPDLEVILAGKLDEVEPFLTDCDDVRSRITLEDAPEVITNHESPVMGVRRKVHSATVQGMLKVRDGEADGFVSAGSTGATLAGGMFRLGRIPGVERPALAPLMPNGKGHFLLIDCGANVDCKPEYLAQFGVMGDAYMKGVMGMEKPRVGLINIGAEAEKGNKLTKETYQLMSQQTSYRFAGNAEARDIPTGDFDVVVADGFDGNIILKYTEGIVSAMMSMLKANLKASKVSKLGAALARPAFRKFKRSMDYNAYGGAPLLGVDGAVVKAHGASGETAVMNALRQARQMLAEDVSGKIREGLKGLSET
jgi:glycerol-3-phosphate acyltransferase PlsX